MGWFIFELSKSIVQSALDEFLKRLSMIEAGDVVGASPLKVAISHSIWHSSPEALGCIVLELSIKSN